MKKLIVALIAMTVGGSMFALDNTYRLHNALKKHQAEMAAEGQEKLSDIALLEQKYTAMATYASQQGDQEAAKAYQLILEDLDNLCKMAEDKVKHTNMVNEMFTRLTTESNDELKKVKRMLMKKHGITNGQQYDEQQDQYEQYEDGNAMQYRPLSQTGSWYNANKTNDNQY